MGETLTIHNRDGTTTKVYPPKLWTPGPQGTPVVQDEPILRSLPDQVKGWPPKGNEHGYNREARRRAAKAKRLQTRKKDKALDSLLAKTGK